jgi:hypothetical protein
MTKERTIRILRVFIMVHASEILSNPLAFKACDGCERAVEKAIAVCPLCRTYRFDLDPARVKQRVLFRQARLEDFYPTLPRIDIRSVFTIWAAISAVSASSSMKHKP